MKNYGLLKYIIDNPLDLDSRKIYWDWLEENGYTGKRYDILYLSDYLNYTYLEESCGFIDAMTLSPYQWYNFGTELFIHNPIYEVKLNADYWIEERIWSDEYEGHSSSSYRMPITTIPREFISSYRFSSGAQCQQVLINNIYNYLQDKRIKFYNEVAGKIYL